MERPTVICSNPRCGSKYRIVVYRRFKLVLVGKRNEMDTGNGPTYECSVCAGSAEGREER